jgi:hypothetical protein
MLDVQRPDILANNCSPDFLRGFRRVTINAPVVLMPRHWTEIATTDKTKRKSAENLPDHADR